MKEQGGGSCQSSCLALFVTNEPSTLGFYFIIIIFLPSWFIIMQTELPPATRLRFPSSPGSHVLPPILISYLEREESRDDSGGGISLRGMLSCAVTATRRRREVLTVWHGRETTAGGRGGERESVGAPPCFLTLAKQIAVDSSDSPLAAILKRCKVVFTVFLFVCSVVGTRYEKNTDSTCRLFMSLPHLRWNWCFPEPTCCESERLLRGFFFTPPWNRY